MIGFIAGVFVGAVVAVFALAIVKAGQHADEENTAPSADEARLNAKKKERADRLAELERQHDNMMNYTGKEQKRA